MNGNGNGSSHSHAEKGNFSNEGGAPLRCEALSPLSILPRTLPQADFLHAPANITPGG